MWNPWASLVVDRFKPIENRDWIIEREGVFLVHAAKLKDFGEYCRARKMYLGLGLPLANFPSYDMAEYGGIVGATEVTGVIEPKDVDEGWHMAGKYGHLLSPKTCRLPFRPLKGLQKFWFVELVGDEEATLREAGFL